MTDCTGAFGTLLRNHDFVVRWYVGNLDGDWCDVGCRIGGRNAGSIHPGSTAGIYYRLST